VLRLDEHDLQRAGMLAAGVSDQRRLRGCERREHVLSRAAVRVGDLRRVLTVFQAAARAIERGRGVAIATVVGVKGSTPRHLGARMAILDDSTVGTVGGGRIEQLVVERGREVAAGAAATIVQQHLVRDLAMCCGGAMEIAITPGAPSREAIALAATTQRAHIVETPLDGSPLVFRDIRDGDPRAHHPIVTDGRLIERLGASERAIVFGLGHVARALGPLLRELGFYIVACDDNDTGALDAPPAWADRVIESFDPVEIERELGGFGADDCLLVITRDHAIDQVLLEKLIVRDDLGYLGMIGSRGKVGRFKKRIEAKGLFDETRWSRLRAPIGLDVGAETPIEIAIAIAAELVARRRRGALAAGDWSIG
jgi:xanthine dehydrogenase accessory factor